jgi:hypothetical protein
MSETPVEELVRRAKLLAGQVKEEHLGNGYFHREYAIGDISLVIEGHYEGNKCAENGVFVELGDVELLCVNYPYGNDGELIRVKVDESVIRRVLDEVRAHMVLDDLADV